jgi:flagellin-like hook-associated protein FlgL
MMQMGLLSLQGNTTLGLSDVSSSREALGLSISRLSSGERITRSSDDVSGLSVATSLQSRTSSLRSALSNLAEAGSLLQVKDGALRVIGDMLQRMNSISAMASSGALRNSERTYLQLEMDGLYEEVDRILDTTTFNTIKLFQSPRDSESNLVPVEDAPPQPSSAVLAPTTFTGMALWLDASNTAQVELTYSINSLSGATASGTMGATTITTSTNISSQLAVGARIRLGAAGNVTTADTVGNDTYTIAAISGTTITTEETLKSNYTAATVRRGLVSNWGDNSGNNRDAVKAIEADMPLWISEGAGRPAAVLFDGAGDHLFSPLHLSTLGNDFSTHLALRPFNFAYRGIMMWRGPAPATGLSISPNSNFGYHWNNQAGSYFYEGPTMVNNQQQLSTMVLKPTNAQFSVNGGATFTNTLTHNVIADSTTNLLVGGDAFAGRWYVGRMSEVIVFENALSATEQVNLAEYQSAKWGIPLTSTGQVASIPGVYSDGYTVDINAGKGTLVGDLREGSSTYKYKIVDNGGSGTSFRIDASTGEIYVRSPKALVSGGARTYTLGVEAQVNGGAVLNLDVQVKVEGEFTNGAETITLPDGINFVGGEDYRTLVNIDREDLDTSILFGEAPLDVMTAATAQESQTRVQGAIDIVTSRRAEVGAVQSRVNYLANAQESAYRNQVNAHAALADTNILQTSTDFAMEQVQSNLSIAMMAQTNKLRSDNLLKILQEGLIEEV